MKLTANDLLQILSQDKGLLKVALSSLKKQDEPIRIRHKVRNHISVIIRTVCTTCMSSFDKKILLKRGEDKVINEDGVIRIISVDNIDEGQVIETKTEWCSYCQDFLYKQNRWHLVAMVSELLSGVHHLPRADKYGWTRSEQGERCEECRWHDWEIDLCRKIGNCESLFNFKQRLHNTSVETEDDMEVEEMTPDRIDKWLEQVCIEEK